MSSCLDLDKDHLECYQQMTKDAPSMESLKGLVIGWRSSRMIGFLQLTMSVLRSSLAWFKLENETH